MKSMLPSVTIVLICGSVFSAMSVSLCQARTITVDITGHGDYSEIQPALDAALDGDTVIVRPGEYITAPLDFNRLHDPQNPDSPRVKDIEVRAEGGPDDTAIISAPGDAFNVSVVFAHGESDASLLDGFRISGGGDGQILCVNNASPTIRNCVIRGGRGSGITCLENAAPVAIACTITNGYARNGGAIFAIDAAPTLKDCLLKDNSATAYCTPPGWICSESPPACSGGSGGAVYCGVGSSVFLLNCSIKGNRAVGAAIGNWNEQCIAYAPGRGGGVFCDHGASVIIENCTITGNHAKMQSTGSGSGGAVCALGRDVLLTNCTVVGNQAYSWSAVGGVAGPAVLINSIVRDNQGDSISPRTLATYCDIEVAAEDPAGPQPEPWPGEGNINVTAHFRRPGQWDLGEDPNDPRDDMWIEGDYRLQADSPCVDSGTSEGAPAFDIEGHGRPCGAGVDIGAYESGDCLTHLDHAFLRGDSNGDGSVDISDAIKTLGVLFLGEGEIACQDAADSNDDGVLDISDAISLLVHLFLGTVSLPAPGPERCGMDPTEDGAYCVSTVPCQ